ncbi:MAG: ABC transporter permease [Armatimonadetes bacterium]|nr:ABC transporter permease [Armatimonadota bacterium]
MRRLLAVARKETIHVTRDVRSLLAALALPTGLLLLYGYAVDFDLRDVRFAVVDHDRTPASRRLIEACARIHGFTYAGELQQASEADQWFERRRGMLVIGIDRGFQRDLQRDGTALLQVLVDGTDATAGATALQYATGALSRVTQSLAATQLRAAGVPPQMTRPAVDVRVRVLYNPNLESRQFMVPGLTAIILTLMASLLTSGVIVRERERGSFELLAASPISPGELLIGKMLPYFALAVFDVVMCVAVGWLAFGVVPRGSLLLLTALSMIFVFGALSLGLFFSCVAETQQVAMLLSFVATLIPTMLLSGFAYPVRNMPVVLQWLGQVFPATHFIVIARGIILKGVGFAALKPAILRLTVISALLIVLAVRRFRKRL